MKNSVFKRILTAAALTGIAVFSVSALISAAPSGLRSIFLNGMDISGARNQHLKNVDVQISENGDVFIIAPHYQVTEEDSFTPLSKFVQGINAPAHKQPQKLSADQVPAAAPVHTEPKALDKAAVPADDGTLQKPEDPPPALPEDGVK
jgi:hypothetical protein